MSEQRSMLQTRAQELGISPKTLRARSLRSLNAAREHLTKAALPFAEIDNSLSVELDDLLREFDAFAERLNESVEWLNSSREEIA